MRIRSFFPKPAIKIVAASLFFLFSAIRFSYGQQTVSGATCVVTGSTYGYNCFSSTAESYTVCVTGGTIISVGSCQSGSLGSFGSVSINVIWNTGISTGSISFTGSAGNGSLTATATSPLAGGAITSGDGQHLTYNTIPAGINCNVSTGGICGAGTYSYQWQKSVDNVNWSAISGATGQNITFSASLTQTTYYRRMVTTSAGTAYSGTATVFVAPQLTGGTISVASGTINYNTSPGLLSSTASAGGGNCSGAYAYTWLQSTDNITFTAAGSNALTFTPGPLIVKTYYKRQVVCGSETAYSNTLTITVNPQVFPGIPPVTRLSISYNTSPGSLTCPAATGGACSGAFAYQWQNSTDGNAWAAISGATSANYTPPSLTVTTYYRRQVTCGTDIEYTIPIAVIVGPSNVNNLNFIRVRDITKPGVLDTASASALTSIYDVHQATQYFDGLGRPIETVAMQQTPLGKDMVSFNQYDAVGRESLKYLPYVATTSDGNYKSTWQQDQNTFNTAQFAGETYYYGQQSFEPSPLNRVSASYAPGLNWVGASRGVGMQYLVNTASDSVRNWTIAATEGSLPTTSAFYAVGLLYKNITTDEAVHQVVEYKDMQGKVILKKVQLAASPGTAHAGWLCTYYIYDDLDNLRFVIQPRCVELINGAWSVTQALADELCFRYEYDLRKRLIIKKVPGAGEVWMVYDIRDRLVMTQDSSLRAAHKWLFTKYDIENRPDSTGTITDPTNYNNQAFHQNLANSSISYPAVASYTNELLTQTYYDDYGWVVGSGSGLGSTMATNYTSSSTYFNTTYNVSPTYAVALTASYLTRGMVTGIKTKVIGTASQFLYTVSFIDDRARPLQTQSLNYTAVKDTAIMQYDFSGKTLRNVIFHHKGGTNAQGHIILTKMAYDGEGRLLTIYKNIDGAGADQLITTNTYNELGQLQNKALGNTIENLAYAYNIRGWLSTINKNFVSGTTNTNYFGMELGYDKTTSVNTTTTYTAAQYNGNITGTIWKSAGDGVGRKYDFTYDNVNRLTAANFVQNTAGSTWDNTTIDFTTSNLTYDANGNIFSMNQKGFKVGGSALIDQLAYVYQTNSNKLAKVTDAVSDATTKLGDFHDGTNGSTDDYSYDGNGNLTLDNNKAISAITYNYLNLPQQLTVTSKGTITYTYDAAGNKLLKTTVDNTIVPTKTTTTLYLAGSVYQNDTLQFIAHEEGRARWAWHKYLNGTTAYAFEYDYFLKDHLGNTRVVLTQQKDTTQYLASMEAAYRATENQLFGNIALTSYARASVPGTYPSDPTTNPNDSVARVNGATGQHKVGPNLILKVMSGDKIDLSVKSFYHAGGTVTTPNSSVTDVLASLAAGLVNIASGSKGSLTDLNNTTTSPVYSALNSFLPSNDPATTGKPKAYLNWILLDEQLKYVNTYPQSGAIVIGSADILNTLAYTGIPITKNGYLYIWVSNETPNWDVFFDNLAVKQYTGPVLEETHYYPFGLTMAGISSMALKTNYAENKLLYNGKERQSKEFSDGSGLDEYDYGSRRLNIQIGRWFVIDPKSEKMRKLSPYIYAADDPIKFIDLDGNVIGNPNDPMTKKVEELLNRTQAGQELWVKMEASSRTIFFHNINSSDKKSNEDIKLMNRATSNQHDGAITMSKTEYENAKLGLDTDLKKRGNFNRKNGMYDKTSDWNETHVVFVNEGMNAGAGQSVNIKAYNLGIDLPGDELQDDARARTIAHESEHTLQDYLDVYQQLQDCPDCDYKENESESQGKKWEDRKNEKDSETTANQIVYWLLERYMLQHPELFDPNYRAKKGKKDQ